MSRRFGNIVAVVLTFLAASGSLPVEAINRYYLRSLEVEDGLSQNMVYCIMQDSSGFMWFGTQDGMNRYDGQSFTVYKKDPMNPKSVGNNGFFSMFENEDGKIWIGTIDGVYIYDPQTDSFARFEATTADGTRIDGIARHLYRDRSGNIWIAVMGKGIFSYNSSRGTLRLYTIKVGSTAVTNIRATVMDSEENLWVATYGQGLFCLNPRTAQTEQYKFAASTAGNNDINDIYILNDKTLLLGTVAAGAQSFDLESRRFAPFMERGEDGQTLFVRKIMRSDEGEIWLCAETGVYIYNQQTRETTYLHHTYNDPYSLSSNAAHSIYQDSEGGIWIGTYFGGVNYVGKYSSLFEKYYPLIGTNSVSGKSISEFCQDDSGRIWIGTEDAGLNCFDPESKRFQQGFISANNIHALMCRGGKLWVGTFADGLYVIDLATMRARSYKSSQRRGSLTSDNIYSIYADRSGTIWIGTMNGLLTYDAAKDSFTPVLPDEITAQVNDIVEDCFGVLWYATLGGGLYSYDRLQNSWGHYPSLASGNDVTGSMVSCLLEDSQKRLWIGTDGMGLCVYDRERDAFTYNISSHDGLPNNVIYRLVEDARGNIWGSTNKGLFRIGATDNSITNYTYAQGLLGDQFNYKSGFRARDGRLYFGGIKGFVAFSPDNMAQNNEIPRVVINSFQVYNKEVQVEGGRSPLLKRAITHTEQLTIPHNISTFSLGFAALSYVSQGTNTYAYKLEGWDKDWIYTNTSHNVTYSNLPKGHYIFRVKASNDSGTWNHNGAMLKIEILPPFYQTTWAHIIYAIFGVAFVFFTTRFIIGRIRRRNDEQIRQFEAQKEKELYNSKIEFFTNITHEIRTPLSLIKMPLDEVMKKISDDDPNRENLSIIEGNAQRLLKLVNELLDFRKAESEGLSLSFVHTDVTRVTLDSVARFAPSSELMGIALKTDLPQEPLWADIDIEIFTKMLSNLLNNALHHAKQTIEVSLTPCGDTFRLQVVNDGDTIAPEYAEKIFLPFFKIDEKAHGSGIGLPFARSLAELHKGTLTLVPRADGLTMFVIELPAKQSHSFNLAQSEEEPAAIDDEEFDEENGIDEQMGIESRQTILIAEDNEEFLNFVARQLKPEYNVLKACDGRQALELLESNYVDVIISDMMMPVMDGMELCRRVKEDLRHSHIPFIMLTAKTSIQAKMDGLKTGTDEYIEKPFSTDFLKARIENLLENRRKIANSYKHSPEVTLDTIAHSKADENFLNGLVDLIYQHIEEVDLNVDHLAAAMNMSRATFYRKVKNISQLTPNDFIRLIRLKRAAELLRQKEYRVNEIAFIVGFSSSSYFSKCFYKQFGVLPKDFDK